MFRGYVVYTRAVLFAKVRFHRSYRHRHDDSAPHRQLLDVLQARLAEFLHGRARATTRPRQHPENLSELSRYAAWAGAWIDFRRSARRIVPGETCLSGAYNTAQFFGWSWGKFRRPRDAARFTLCWIGMFLAAMFLFLRILPAISIFEMRTLLPEAEVKE